MPLTGSGQISFNDVRTETSQSAMTNYAMSGWTWGLGNFDQFNAEGIIYAPINVLSSGSRFSQSNKLNFSDLSMSAWYNYNHTASINVGTTASIYLHADDAQQCYPRSMIPIELGTTNATYSIYISGSESKVLKIYYGKPWYSNGSAFYASNGQVIFSGTGVINSRVSYKYTYNASSGSKIYCVLYGDCP